MPISRVSRSVGTLVLVLFAASPAQAGGPRWHTGLPFYTNPDAAPVVFFTTAPLYFTDPGPLSANVSHAQADAMVAAAAATWNVPTSRLTLAQGGTLAEHVSGANTYFDGNNVVFPDDVKLANYHAIPIPIIYDTDGSVIDTLLGSGASNPAGCRQNGVVESVDGLDPAGTIDHAIILLNGRCVGSTPDQLTQMQYQLMRTFGRVIGVAWSQLNDVLFTGVRAPLAVEMNNWPVMHPIDVLCGPYTFKCMAQPFVLRPDDLSALAEMYTVDAGNITPEKTLTNAGALNLFGYISFPTGQGMDGVNVVLTRRIAFSPLDQYEVISGVTGSTFQQFSGNPVAGAAAGPAQSSGATNDWRQGLYIMQRVPIEGPVGWESLYATTEPINPLYSGAYAIGPYLGAPPAMSGAPVTAYDGLEAPGRIVAMNATVTSAPNLCNPGLDGVENAPVAPDPTGWWTGLLCANWHSAWITHTPLAGHSWTLEMTALDENGIASDRKARLLLGVWNAADPMGTQPTVAATAAPFNALAAGMTQLRMSAASTTQSYRIAIADDRGHGRPDFTYKARLLYADTVSPVQLGVSGGRITVTGQGFRAGNVVKVNGVVAPVISWSATQIVATAPNMRAAGMSTTGFADVDVIDASTHGSTTIQTALSYDGAGGNSIVLVSAPGQVQTGTPSSVAFAVRVLSTDGVTPAPGAAVQISVPGGAGIFTACGAATCLLTTDANGDAQSYLNANAPGLITMTATEQTGFASVQATANATALLRVVTSVNALRYLAPGVPASFSAAVQALQNGFAAPAQSVSWSTSTGLSLAAGVTWTDGGGIAAATVSTVGLGAGTQATVQGCAWINVCADSMIFGVDPAEWRVVVVSGAGQSAQAGTVLAPVLLRIVDSGGHPVEAAPVTLYQTVDAWQGVCPAQGRCAAAPVLAVSQKTMTTDAAGQVSVTPLEIAGVASVVNIVVVSGTNGFTSLSLTKTP